MGCWNKTCGISNLFIEAGEKVYVFALEQNLHHDRCYSTAFWKPVMLPFLSEYNDYGGGENSHKNIGYILDGLKQQLVEMPEGENQYHDISVSADQLNEELFFNAVHEGRLKIDGRGDADPLIDFVMLRADIVDSICENWQRELYVGQGKGTGGHGNNYIFYKFEDIVAKVPEFMDKMSKELLEPSKDENENSLPPALRFKYSMQGLAGVYDYKDRNLVSIYLSGINNYQFSQIVRPVDVVLQLMADGNREEAQAVLVDILRASFINSFMEFTRKQWMPAGHEGSQTQEHMPYRVLCNAINSVLDYKQADREDEDFDDKLVDMQGTAFHEGCKVARAIDVGDIQICVVTKIAEGQLYLNNSKQSVRFPDRLLIIERDPLIKLIDNYEQSKKSKSQYE